MGTVEVLWPEDKHKDYPRKLLPFTGAVCARYDTTVVYIGALL